MISILIPVYNYDIVPLVKELHKQLIDAEIFFEIFAYDDGSKTRFKEINAEIDDLSFTNYQISKRRIGREQTRQILAQKAKHDWVLFLDADTLPITSDFISSYLKSLNPVYDAIFGGILYQEQPPKGDFMLRWKYGIAREAVNAKIRNKNPFKAVVSANFIIKKTVFIELNGHILGKDYGYDIFFASLLKSNAKKVIHIDNQVYHLGIEKNDCYLSKNEEATKTYLALLRDGSISTKDSRILFSFSVLKRYRLHYILSIFFEFFQPSIRRNLLSNNPNISLFQLYRLSYMCFIDIKTSN